MDFDKLNKVHNEIGMVLSNVSGSRDIQRIRIYQDQLSEMLAIGNIRSLNDLYEAIIQVTK